MTGKQIKLDDGEFDVGYIAPPPDPIKDWQVSLAAIEYDPTVLEITKVGIVSDAAIRNAVKMAMLEMAETLTVEAGYAAWFKGRVYSAIVHHVRAKFLNGNSLGLAERADVDFAWKMLRQVKEKVGAVPGLVAGVVEYGD